MTKTTQGTRTQPVPTAREAEIKTPEHAQKSLDFFDSRVVSDRTTLVLLQARSKRMR